ncbi:MAG: ABC transporter ATP-binding protein [Lentisphaerae bacterium]|nr:ABC transporter ATP-binding protein [Lentisphaerota bacterium]
MASDLQSDGHFGEEWLVISGQTLRVWALVNQRARIKHELPLVKIHAPQTDLLIGGGALLVTVDGQSLEIIRYTNACQRKFDRLTQYLGELAQHQRALASGQTSSPPDLEPDPHDRQRCSKCGLLLPEGTRVCPACLHKGKVMLRLMAYLKPYWREMILIWGLMLTGLVLSLIPPYLTRPLMDRVLVPTGVAATAAERIKLLGWLALGLLAAQTASQLIGIFRGRTLVKLGSQLSHDLRLRLYAHMQMLSLRFFDKRSVGAMVSRIVQDTDSLESVLVDGMQHFVVNVLMLLGIGTVLLSMNWKLTLLVLIPVPIVIFLSRKLWQRIRSLWHGYWHYRARLTSTVSDALSGVRVVKAFAKEQEEIARFHRNSQNLLSANMQAEQMWSTLFPILWLITSTGSLMVWYVGGREVIGGSMTLGTMMTFIAYLGMFYGPLQFLSRIADFLARSLTSAERVFEVLDTEIEIKEAADAQAMPRMEGRVEFRDVFFGYEPLRPVIKNMNLAVRPGEMIGFVGRSGAGKSTTINLLSRFFDVNRGAILVDGVDIRQIKQRDLRAQIGVVLQETFLFNGTIAENIAYAKPEASPAEIMAAARTANAHDFIIEKPEGYDTKVGERGQLLSGGERQRIAIARAILHDPRILILDEATAAMDTETEKQIQEALTRIMRGRTTFVIAHRLSTLRNADRLVLLQKGQIVEMGTHEDLWQRSKDFRRLVKMQQEMSTIIAKGKPT